MDLLRNPYSPCFTGENTGIEKILRCVTQATGISQKMMRSKIRNFEVVLARYLYFFVSRRFTTMSLTKIGNMLNKSHSMVLHGEKELQQMLNTRYKDVNQKYNRVIEILNQ